MENTKSKKIIPADEVDAKLLRERASVVAARAQQLGFEVERHELTKKTIVEGMAEARQEYSSALRTVAGKYVFDHQTYYYDALMGAFILESAGDDETTTTEGAAAH